MRRFREEKDGKEKGKGKGKAAKRRPVTRRRACRLCADTKLILDYKDLRLLQQFISERGRIIPRRVSGNCAYHQRTVGLAVKRARLLALLPFTSMQH
ncbi:MAG: 30S ribosomal protein S18 [Deltaproteobacteria bacterium]|nr:30S ribosomal protein S18 [Deltaproteobacteria bacterium]